MRRKPKLGGIPGNFTPAGTIMLDVVGGTVPVHLGINSSVYGQAVSA